MTDEAVAKLIAGAKKGIGNQAPRYYVGAIETELNRARASEAAKDAEIARLKRLMARAAYRAQDLQPDTLAGAVHMLLTVGGPEVEKNADVIRALAGALISTASVTDDDGPCWCGGVVEKKNGRHFDLQCVERRAALRLAGRL